MATGKPKGRPRKLHPQFLCERLHRLRRIFAYRFSKAEWIKMNRPLRGLAHLEEDEPERRREYAELLNRGSFSELQENLEPSDDNSYPALIFKWQCEEGLIYPSGEASKIEGTGPLRPKDAQYVAERQYELARRLALFIVASESRSSPEYLQKICRKYDPKADEAQQDFFTSDAIWWPTDGT